MGTNSLAQSLGGTSPEQWATDFLSLIGAPVNSTNVGTVVRWENQESGGGGGAFNPLNTTQGGYGGQSTNSVGVKDYPDYVAGLNATVQAFMSGLSKYGYQHILDGFRASDQPATFAAIDASPWGTKGLPVGSEAGPTYTAAAGVLRPTASLQTAIGAQGSVDTSSSSGPASADDQCLWKLPGIDLGITSLGGQCLLKRSQGRALLGAVAVLGGGVLVIVGLAFVFSSTKVGNQVLKSAAPAMGAVGAVV